MSANSLSFGGIDSTGDGNTQYPVNLNQWAQQPQPSSTGLPAALLQALMQSYGGSMTPDLVSAAGPLAQLSLQGNLGSTDLANQLTLGQGALANQRQQIANQAPLYSGLSSMLGSIGGLFGGGSGAPAAAASVPGMPGGIGVSNPRGIIGSAASGGGSMPGATGAAGGGSSGGGLLGGLFGSGGLKGLLSGLFGGSGGGVPSGVPTGGGETAMGGFGAPLLTGFQSTNTPQGASLGGMTGGGSPLNGGWGGGRGPGIGGGYSFTNMGGGNAMAANSQAVPPGQRRMFNYAGGMSGANV